MNNQIKSEKFRKLSIVALVTGIMAQSLPMTNLFFGIIYGPPRHYDDFFMLLIMFFYVPIGLSVIAVVCGSIDLIRIKIGRNSKKGMGFDIAGIVLAVISNFFPSPITIPIVVIPGAIILGIILYRRKRKRISA